MRPDHRVHRVPCSRHRLGFSAVLCGLSPSAVHPKLALQVSSSRELYASSRVLRRPTCPSCLEKSCDQTDRLKSASHGVLVPHRGNSWRRPPLPRESQPQGHVPSAAFRTPSTVCSATNLAGLFHPAATSRVCPSGVCPSPRSRTGFPRPNHALLPFRRNRLRFDPRQQLRPPTSGLRSPRKVRCLRKAGEGPVQPAPLVGFLLLRELSLRTVGTISRPFRPRPWLR